MPYLSDTQFDTSEHIDTLNGVDIWKDKGKYFAMVYDAETERSIEFVEHSLCNIKDKIQDIQAKSGYLVLKDLAENFGVKDCNIYDFERLRDNIVENQLKLINEALTNPDLNIF